MTKLWKVTYKGKCVKGLPSSKKNSIGWWRTVGQVYTEKETIPFNGEPTKDILFSLINLCQNYLEIEKESITFEFIEETNL